MRLIDGTVISLLACAALVSALSVGTAAAPARLTAAAPANFAGETPLTLINGWTSTQSVYGTAVPSVNIVNGVAHLEGAIMTSGTNTTPFILPKGYRPKGTVPTSFMPVDLCNATNGALAIGFHGKTYVFTQSGFSNAQCFTSLDGAIYVVNNLNDTPLSLNNGWAPLYRKPTVRSAAGIVYFAGTIENGTSADAFVLPAGFRPAKQVYVSADMCGNTVHGRLIIAPDGTVSVQNELDFSYAQCFTSLEGASFAINGNGATPLTPINGWTNGPFGTANASVYLNNGVVHFEGAIAGGTTTNPFVLPSGFRPDSSVYVKVDLCNATNGRLIIDPSGTVTIQAENGTFSNAQCFTSLDGASFEQWLRKVVLIDRIHHEGREDVGLPARSAVEEFNR